MAPTLLDVAWLVAYQGRRAAQGARWQMDFPEVLGLLPVCRALRADDRLTAQLARAVFARDGEGGGRTLLQNAARVGDARRVAELVAAASAPGDAVLDVPVRNMFNAATPLTLAVMNGHVDAARALLAAGASCRQALHGVGGMPTPYTSADELAAFPAVARAIATSAARDSLVRDLVGDAGDIDADDALRVGLLLHLPDLVTRFGLAGVTKGMLALDFEVSIGFYFGDFIRRLTEHPLAPVTAAHLETSRALAALMMPHADSFYDMLLLLSTAQDSVTLTSLLQTNRGRSMPREMLWACAGAGMRVEVAALRAAGARLDDNDSEIYIPAILHAAILGHVDIVRDLAFSIPAETGQCVRVALVAAVRSGLLDVVTKLLADNKHLDFDKTVGQEEFCESALSLACARADVDIVRVLLDGGLDARTINDSGRPLLWYATGGQVWHLERNREANDRVDDRVEIIRLLLAHGAVVGAGSADSILQLADSALIARALAEGA